MFISCWQIRVVVMAVICSAVILLASQVQAGEERRRQVAVLPIDVLAAESRDAESLRHEISASMLADFDIELIDDARVDEALALFCPDASHRSACLNTDSTLLAFAEKVEADLLLAGELAEMGDTRVLMLRIADCHAHSVASENLTVDRAQAQQGVISSSLLLGRLLPKKNIKQDQWYDNWQPWVIGGIGVASVTLVVGISVVYALANPSGNATADWDRRGSLP